MTTVGNTYALDIGQLGSTRLHILNETLNPYSLAFIEKNTELEGANVLEIACGVGIFSCELAHKITDSGSILGIDSSEHFIKQAQNRALEQELTHAHFELQNVYHLNSLKAQYDVIYARAILCHLKEVPQLLRSFKNLLKPNGLLICEEVAIRGAFVCEPPNATYDEWAGRFRNELINLHSTDFNIGQKLLTLGPQAGLKLKAAQYYQPVLLTSRQKKLMTISTQEVMPKLVEKGVYTEEEGLDLIQRLKQLEEDSHVLPAFLRIAQLAFYNS